MFVGKMSVGRGSVYLGSRERLDIANAVVKLTQFSDKQSEECQKAEKRIYRYLKDYRDIVMGKLFERI